MRITLRLKLICLITVLLLGSVGSYLYFAINLFVTDKTSYVYDTTLATTNYLAKDVTNTIQNATENAFTFALIGKRKPALIKELLSLKTKILAFKIESRENIPVFIHPRLKELYGIQSEKLRELSENFELTTRRDIEVVNITKDIGSPAVNLVIFNRYAGERYIYTIFIGDLIDSFQKNQTFKNYLITDKGQSIIGDKLLSDEIVKKITNSKLESLSQRIEGKENQLLSFTKLEELGLVIVSQLSEKKAFEVTEFLIKKSSATAIILLCLGVMLGLYFSSGITKPLELLVKATKLVASGKYGTQIKTKSRDEVSLLAISFNSMSSEIKNKILEIEEANIQLDYMNKNLEKLVAKRTAELAEANSYLDTMINSLGQGLLVLDDKANCSPFYTKACLELFKSEPEGKNYFDLLKIQDPKKLDTLNRWVGNLYSEKIPFESLADLGPKVFGSDKEIGEPGFKHIALEYFPMRRKSESVENVLVVATDKTNEVIAEEKFKREREESERMIFIQENRRQFISFLRDTEALAEDIIKLATSSLSSNYDEIKMHLHSIKGSSGIYKLANIYRGVDEVEERLQGFSIDSDSLDIKKHLIHIVNLVKNEITAVKSKDKVILGEEVIDGIPRFIKRLDNMRAFEKVLTAKGDSKLTEEFKNKIYRISVSGYFKSIDPFLQELAERLNKEIKPLEISGGDTLVDPIRYTSFFDSLIHLFRNILDHGIELPHIREEKGKDEEGIIKIKISKLDKILQVSVFDDGAGIDANKIREVMKERGYPAEKLSSSDAQIIYHIFDANFSTVSEASDISGRGVGMSAIKNEVSKLKGRIKIQSKKDKGTVILFEVPYA